MAGRASTWLSGVGVAAVAALGLFLAGGVAGADAPSKVTISKGDPRFHGRVVANRPGCVEDRKIRLFHAYNKRDELVAKTRTGSDGKWRIDRPRAKTGIYYVKANQVRAGSGRVKCRDARSETVFVRK